MSDYLDYDSLSIYDEQIKTYINSVASASAESVSTAGSNWNNFNLR